MNNCSCGLYMKCPTYLRCPENLASLEQSNIIETEEFPDAKFPDDYLGAIPGNDLILLSVRSLKDDAKSIILNKQEAVNLRDWLNKYLGDK